MGLEKMGAEIILADGYIEARAKKLKGATIYFDIPTVTGTENLMMAAALAEGESILENAACEPEVVDLTNALISMGAKIEGCGTSTIIIEGVDKLNGCTHIIESDNLEAGTFIAASALTPGTVLVKNVNFEYLNLFLHKLKEIGVNFEKGQGQITVYHSPNLRAVKVQALPHPGFPTDLLPIIAPLLVKAEGRSLLHDPLYDNRFGYMLELRKMGGDIEVVDPHRAFIFGPKEIEGIDINSLDIRSGASLILAALMAKGMRWLSSGWSSPTEPSSAAPAALKYLMEANFRP